MSGKGKPQKDGRLLRWALRNGIQKGFLGANRRWMIMGGIAVGVKVLRKIAGSEPEVVYSAKVEPGQTLVIAHGREPR